ncbi:hypothetical protein U14_04798 [Candidatus Moduliflexus flocculans]|uniref:PIN domain-containing protein n=1 Tax=Candidatus Moduliflexus flocculans TaxID=1499966 RepID=A0A0S6W172_9BACT|nr:hypothetical protein U14_04798 [Candidatus Moduliflexus flocculans]
MVIFDTDILSMFAKAEALETLLAFFDSTRCGMTPAIADEIAVPLLYGYDFPTQILSRVQVMPIKQEIATKTVQFSLINAKLGRGEREAIAFCEVECASFITNDAIARKFAQAQGVTVFSLQAMLRAFWESGFMPRSEVRTLLERIKRADALEVSEQVEQEIFRDERSE